MKGEYDDFQDNDQSQYIGLGASKHKRISKNQQIYGDFYQPYQQQQPKQNIHKPKKSYGDAYNRFKAGSVIQNYAAECDVHIPEPKKKVKLQQEEQQPIQQPEVGQFNLQSFLKDFQQKQQLEKIQQEQEEQEYNGPFCLNSKVKNSLKLVRIGEDQDDDIDGLDLDNLNVNEMTFEQYRKLVMRNGKKEQAQPQKRLTAEEKEKEKQYITSYGKGYSMLEKMGFNLSKGLGKEEKGITKPVEAVFKTAFTTKDSQLREQQNGQQQQAQDQEQQTAAQTALFQFRSKNIKINNFLLDLKNKFESVSSKMYFYEREIQQVDRDSEISQSLMLQKGNQLEEYEEEIGKLKGVRDVVKGRLFSMSSNGKSYQGHKQESTFKNAHLGLKYKLDLLYVKTQYTNLKSLSTSTLLTTFPTSIKHLHTTLTHFYLQKQRQTLKHYRNGIKNFKNSQRKVVNLQEEVIDLVDETEPESVVTVSLEDQLRIVRMVELVAENTFVIRAREVFAGYDRLEDVKDFRVLECLRAVKDINRNSQIVKSFINDKIKPLVMNYYNTFDYEQTSQCQSSKSSKDSKIAQFTSQCPQPLPHHILFPFFQIMDPSQLQLSKLLKVLSNKLWNLKRPTLHSIIKPLLPHCLPQQRSNFINFYLAPRLLYFLQQFDLTQPHICKQLMGMLKLHKQLIDSDSLKDLLNCTIVPEIVMTYRKYEKEGTSKEELGQWAQRWVKEIGKVVANYLEDVLAIDFNIFV